MSAADCNPIVSSADERLIRLALERHEKRRRLEVEPPAELKD